MSLNTPGNQTNTNSTVPTTQKFQSRMRRVNQGCFFCGFVGRRESSRSELRVRFTSRHPKDYPIELLSLMSERYNVCQHLHLLAQSGSSSVLKRMKWGYTRDAYLELIQQVYESFEGGPANVALSSDFSTGFCGKTQQDHKETLSLLKTVRYDQAYMFAYSTREDTHAHQKLEDNVTPLIKQKRLRQIIDTF